MQIPLSKPFISDEEIALVSDTLSSLWVTQGPKVESFERKVCELTGAQYAVAVSNCTVALFLSLLLHDIGPEDEVICPALSYIASANAIKHTGASPVFVDVSAGTYNMSPEQVEKAITPNTKAVMVIHQLGQPAEMRALRNITAKHNLALIEDAACALGAQQSGTYIGADSEAACFSFHPRKIITTGEGGMILTNRKDFYERLRLLRHHGMSVSDVQRHNATEVHFEDHVTVGYNFRMTDIQAAVGLAQLDRISDIISDRRQKVALYKECLANTTVTFEQELTGNKSNYQSLMVMVPAEQRDSIIIKARKEGIAMKRGVMNILSASAYVDYRNNYHLPETEKLEATGLLLPLFYGITDDEVRFVCDFLKREL